jgi:hypothetical protein
LESDVLLTKSAGVDISFWIAIRVKRHLLTVKMAAGLRNGRQQRTGRFLWVKFTNDGCSVKVDVSPRNQIYV